MNNIQVEQFKKKLAELEKFGDDLYRKYDESEIVGWIAECVRVFYEIGVDAVIIRHFLEYFSFEVSEVEDPHQIRFSGMDKKYHKVNAIGPFHEQVGTYGWTDGYVLSRGFGYTKIAFSVARNILKNKIEEKRIVPPWLAVEMSKKSEQMGHISSSLENMEARYKKLDAEGLVSEAITLLHSVLNFDVDLAQKSKLGSKLNFLIENKDKLKDFGVSKDLVQALNCARVIRNEKVEHKDIPLKYEIPFMIATSFAYLVIFFVECAILHGKVISYNEK